MAIVSGYQKMKDYIKQSSGYKLLSRWANANTVECDDGKTLQNKVGGISGISSSLTANSTTQAASTNLTNQLYQNFSQLNSELKFPDGTKFYPDIQDGEYGFNTAADRGADTFHPFRGEFEISAWYYQINGGKTELILDSADYKILSIGQQDGGGNLNVFGKDASETIIPRGEDGYYDISAYNQVIIRMTNSIYTNGTLNSIRLW